DSFCRFLLFNLSFFNLLQSKCAQDAARQQNKCGVEPEEERESEGHASDDKFTRRAEDVLAQLERGYGDERERGGHDRDGQQVEEAAASEVVVSDRQSDGQDENRKAESRERDHRTPEPAERVAVSDRKRC